MKVAVACTLSALASYGVMLFGRQLGLSDDVATFLPGPFFALALGATAVGSLAGWRLAILLSISIGWEVAYEAAVKIESPLVLAGAVGGAIGGAGLIAFLAPFPHARGPRNAGLLVLAGTALGAVGLPAGFLFGEASGGSYLFLLFVPWQVGMGLLLERLTRPS